MEMLNAHQQTPENQTYKIRCHFSPNNHVSSLYIQAESGMVAMATFSKRMSYHFGFNAWFTLNAERRPFPF